MQSIKSQLCNIITILKNERGMTYDDVINMCGGWLHYSQLSSILRHDGDTVSVQLMEDVVKMFGYSVELSIIQPFELLPEWDEND